MINHSSSAIGLDCELLPPALLEFAVLADTHYMLPDAAHSREFSSRSRQADRAAHSLALAAGCSVSCAVHLGDHVQDYPNSPTYGATLTAAMTHIQAAGLHIYHVAGNTDVGDKPDPTTPGPWVTEDSLNNYHRIVGPSWYSFNVDPLHFVVLNTSILNSDLPAAADQDTWLEDDLTAHHRNRIVVCLHYPLFLRAESDPDLGNYDTIGEPARSRLLQLIRESSVELVLSGHSHFAFFNRIGDSRFFVLPSTSFTRPGFGELFSSPPPAEHGRDDVAKLGFHLVRVHESDIRLHFVRTGDQARAGTDQTTDEVVPVVTCVSRDLPTSPLGVVLRHPLATYAEVPIAFPSADRQPVRNDYPLLGIMELGMRHVIVPAEDLRKPDQRDRLAVLRDEGVAVTASWLWRPDTIQALRQYLTDCSDLASTLEILLPPGATLDQAIPELRAGAEHPNIETCLAQMAFNPTETGQELPRPRRAYRPADLPNLDRELGRLKTRVHRVLVVVNDPTDLANLPIPGNLTHINTLDTLVHLHSDDTARTSALVSEAILWTATRPGSRLYLDSLVMLDRTLDEASGLLDRLCNPTPLFHLIRSLNSIIFSNQGPYTIHSIETIPNLRVIRAGSPESALILLLSSPTRGPDSQTPYLLAPYLSRMVRGYNLSKATVTTTGNHVPRWLDAGDPVLILQTSADSIMYNASHVDS